eukprot:4329038-Amphidinium_carterae.1
MHMKISAFQHNTRKVCRMNWRQWFLPVSNQASAAPAGGKPAADAGVRKGAGRGIPDYKAHLFSTATSVTVWIPSLLMTTFQAGSQGDAEGLACACRCLVHSVSEFEK